MVTYALMPVPPFLLGVTLIETPFDWIRWAVIVLTIFISGSLLALIVNAERLESPTAPVRLLFSGMILFKVPVAYAIYIRLGQPEAVVWFTWPALAGLVLILAALVALWHHYHVGEGRTL